MARFSFDHAVIVVPELREALEAYRSAGFEVKYGGRHQGSPTHNALIPVEGHSYLELLAPRSRYLPARLRRLRQTPHWSRLLHRRTPVQQRFLQLTCSTGFADFCLRVPDLNGAVRAARSRGLEISDPVAMGRRRLDEQHVAWRLAIPAARSLPFLIEDRTPTHLRVPEPLDHPGLRLQRVSEIVLPVPNLAEVVDAYDRLLGWAAAGSEGNGAVFSINTLRVTLRGLPRAVSAQPASLRLVVAGQAPELTGRIAADGIHLVTRDQLSRPG